MTLGDRIRRNVATVSKEERIRLRDAFLNLDNESDPRVIYPDGVTYWDKQEQIHVNGHETGLDVHDGPAFIPWHRELCNRLESLLREVDSKISLHYWDWTTDPRATPDGRGGVVNLFTIDFMGNAVGDAGEPFANYESNEDAELGNGHKLIWRNVNGGRAGAASTGDIPPDVVVLNSANQGPRQLQFQLFDSSVHGAHDSAHSYVGGSISNPHYSFHDPFVFLLHSNLDRLWAMWQTDPQNTWRLDPQLVYGIEGNGASLRDIVNPWAGTTNLRPWGPPDNLHDNPPKTYKDDSIVLPQLYDTTLGR
jgi:hypothetical protein